MNRLIDVGPVTAYAAAVSKGYTGTYEEFAEQQAHYAESAAQVAHNKDLAWGYSQNALTYAQNADAASQTAGEKALEAQHQAEEAEDAADDARNFANDAVNAARDAASSAAEIEDLTVQAHTLPAGSSPTVEKTKVETPEGTHYDFNFGLAPGPKGDKGDFYYAVFSIDEDGELNVTYQTGYAGPTFSINNNGELEVSVT